MLAKSGIVVLMVVSAGLLASRRPEMELARTPLDTLPLQLGGWRGYDAQPLADDVTAQLGVDEYVNRVYLEGLGNGVGMYIGYYASQRQGDTMHSPQNCLPGAGWRPIESNYLDVSTATPPVRVNRYVIQKGADRQVVLYWYQGRGRVVANEYVNKLLLMWDAARLNRTNGALVRVISPVIDTVTESTRTAARFTAALLPLLTEHIP